MKRQGIRKEYGGNKNSQQHNNIAKCSFREVLRGLREADFMIATGTAKFHHIPPVETTQLTSSTSDCALCRIGHILTPMGLAVMKNHD
jgi:hypothetical protein